MELNRSYSTIFFDLDGTISDSYPGIVNSIVYALNKLDLPVPEEAVLKNFLGPPLAESFSKYCGMNKAQAFRTVDVYREYYAEKGIFEITIYDGLEDALGKLKKAGKTLAVATSKAEPYAIQILEHVGLDKYFDFICGATMDASRVEKPDVISYALSKLPGTDPSDVLMIGDRRHDAQGAAAFGLGFIGVLYGFGSRDELAAAGAKYFAAQPYDLVRMIL